MFDSVNHIISQRQIRYLDRCAEPSRVPKDDFIRKLSRLTDCEEALLLGCPPIGPFLDKRKFMAEPQERAREPYLPGLKRRGFTARPVSHEGTATQAKG